MTQEEKEILEKSIREVMSEFFDLHFISQESIVKDKEYKINIIVKKIIEKIIDTNLQKHKTA